MMYCLVILDCIAKASAIIICTIGECFNTFSCGLFCAKIAHEMDKGQVKAILIFWVRRNLSLISELPLVVWQRACCDYNYFLIVYFFAIFFITCFLLQYFSNRVFFCNIFYNMFFCVESTQRTSPCIYNNFLVVQKIAIFFQTCFPLQYFLYHVLCCNIFYNMFL